MANYEVIGPVAVVRGDNKSERYLYKGAQFSDAGLDAENIKHLVKVKLIAKSAEAKAETAPVEIPEGDPSEKWTVAQLDAYAQKSGVDFGSAKTKDDKLAALVAAKAASTPSE